MLRIAVASFFWPASSEQVWNDAAQHGEAWLLPGPSSAAMLLLTRHFFRHIQTRNFQPSRAGGVIDC